MEKKNLYDQKNQENIRRIVLALRAAGYDPYAQLYAYVMTGNVAYITRTANARELIRRVDIHGLKRYLLHSAA